MLKPRADVPYNPMMFCIKRIKQTDLTPTTSRTTGSDSKRFFVLMVIPSLWICPRSPLTWICPSMCHHPFPYSAFSLLIDPNVVLSQSIISSIWCWLTWNGPKLILRVLGSYEPLMVTYPSWKISSFILCFVCFKNEIFMPCHIPDHTFTEASP